MSHHHPVGYESDFVAPRSRATTFFRLLLAIPHFIVLMIYSIGLFLTVIAAWFAIVITGRYPEGLYRFNAGVVQYLTRVNAYVWLAADPFPSFALGDEPGYPVRLPVAPPQASYSRLKTGLRAIIGIPVMLINYALNLVLQVSGLISWFWIVITGRQNSGLQSALDLGLAYYGRSTAYFCLLSEDWPPFSPAGTETLGPGAPGGTGGTLEPAAAATPAAPAQFSPPAPGGPLAGPPTA